jgi:hypothetical protein
VLLFSRLMGEKFAGTPYARYFADPAGPASPATGTEAVYAR